MSKTLNTRFHGASLGELRTAIDHCRACSLWANATQGVCGEGKVSAEVMLVGEQPGDQEDKIGHPFVGPAGKLLDQALIAAQIERSRVYVTNAVRHFKWIPRGKRRLHKKPALSEIAACSDWLKAEIDLVRPKIIVCLGATATQALLGPSAKVTLIRGQLLESDIANYLLVTVHPSSILRIVGEERKIAFISLVEDLKKVHQIPHQTSPQRTNQKLATPRY